MATLNRVLANIEQHIGFPTSRTRQIARRLAEASIIPSGGPRRSPELTQDHFLALVAASAVDSGLGDVLTSHHRLFAMTIGGLPITADVPEQLHDTAWQRLQVLVELALGDLDSQRDVVETQIEFVASPVAEIVIRERDGKSVTFHEPGHLRGAWRAGHRRCVKIRGGALVTAARSIFS
jgi:hypothetical protein